MERLIMVAAALPLEACWVYKWQEPGTRWKGLF